MERLGLIANIFVGLLLRISATKSGCPSDAGSASSSCLQSVTTDRHRHLSAVSEFFTGIDVEYIRAICSDLREASVCVSKLRQRCTSAEKVRDIDARVHPHITLGTLCTRPNIMEEYAISQNCLQSHRSQSRVCLNNFLVSTSGWGSQDPAHFTRHTRHTYCSRVTDLVECVQAHVNRTCGRVSASLVDSLVRAGLKSSYVCSQDNDAGLATSTTKRAPTSSMGYRPANKHAYQSNTSDTPPTAVPSALLITTLNILIIRNLLESRRH